MKNVNIKHMVDNYLLVNILCFLWIRLHMDL